MKNQQHKLDALVEILSNLTQRSFEMKTIAQFALDFLQTQTFPFALIKFEWFILPRITESIVESDKQRWRCDEKAKEIR